MLCEVERTFDSKITFLILKSTAKVGKIGLVRYGRRLSININTAYKLLVVTAHSRSRER